LNFLDHHLKHGNSLIGSNFDQIFSHPTEDQKRLDSERYQFGDPQEIKESFQEQYLEIEEMPENTVEQIHEKEQAYKQFISANTLYQQFNQLANIHTRQYFEKEANSSDYESFLINIGNPGNPFENTEWYKNAQQDAGNRNYFHWQLEFPKVFFGEQEGFDAVVGNPPYVNSKLLPEGQKNYLEEVYQSTTGRWDIYSIFVELGLDISLETSYILPSMFFRRPYGEGLREVVSDEGEVYEIVDLSDFTIFEDATNYVCIFTVSRNLDRDEFKVYTPKNLNLIDKDQIPFYDLKNSELSSDSWEVIPTNVRNIISAIPDEFVSLEEVTASISEGIHSGKDSVFFLTREEAEDLELEKELLKPVLKGKDIKRYSPPKTNLRVVYPYEDGEVISAETLAEEYPQTWSYLNDNEEALKDRSYVMESNKEWYEIWCERDKEIYTNPKILLPEIADSNKFTLDMAEPENYFNTKVKSLKTNDSDIDERTLLGVLNSKLIEFIYRGISPPKRGGYRAFKTGFMNELEVPETKSSEISEKVEEILELNQQISRINLNIEDYLGNSAEDPDGKTLGELYMPVEGLSDEVVSDTSADRDSLRIGGVEFEESNGELVLRVSARYKPEDSENIDEDELDRWGYFETEKVPAMKFNVEDKMRPLIEEFVSLAVDEAGGFAGLRESATKTNSVIDRLEKLTLPKLEDVEEGLEKFIDNREEAEELEEEIQETDELIDAIVFDLYDLTEEEVETVLDSLDTKEGERGRILESFIELN
jgi:hypothetical protein